MEVVIIVAIAVVCVAAIVGGLIIFYTKGPQETPAFQVVNYRDPPIMLKSRTETDPLLFGMEVPSHTPPSFITKPANNDRPMFFMVRRNARKHRASSRASSRLRR
jgi:hypothetical protein